VIEHSISREICNKMQDFEMEMLNKYTNTVSPYFSIFNKMGYELKVELGWLNLFQKTWSAKRLPLTNGYECYVYCLVKKDGKEVRIKSSDGEADYYPLITSWMISCAYRRFHKLKVTTYEDIDDVEVDINEFLEKLKWIE